MLILSATGATWSTSGKDFFIFESNMYEIQLSTSSSTQNALEHRTEDIE